MRVYEGKEISIPQDLNLTELLHKTASPIPESHIIASDSLTSRSLTLGQLRTRAGRIANGLKKTWSCADGDKWALIVPNSVDYIELAHAILWTGGVLCPINHAMKATEIAHALAVTRPRFVFAYSAVLGNIIEAVELAQKVFHDQGIEWPYPNIMTVIGKFKGYRTAPDDFLDDEKLAIPHYTDTRDRLASIHLSSGTTGKPKGVKLTHYNFVANTLQLYAHDSSQFHSRSRTVCITPFVHIALTTLPLFLGPYTGMMHHAMPVFNFADFGPLVSSVRPTVFQGVPSIALHMANSDITLQHDFSSAEIINCGSILSPEFVSRLTSRAPWQIIQVYGMTEAAPYVAYQKLHQLTPPDSVGHLLPGIKAVLKMENTFDDAPEGGPGELWIQGPNITTGYTDPEANAKAFPMTSPDSGGRWYNTGDVCTISPAGILSVVGRTKELIKYKGFQVSPAELEALLNTHPHVMEAGVAATWDESQLTELPTAYVILKQEDPTTAAVPPHQHNPPAALLRDIHDRTDAAVSGYKKLRGGVWAVTQLPKNATGKFVRNQLGAFKTGVSSLDSPPVPSALRSALVKARL